MDIVFLDPGHGSPWPGAVGPGGLRECDVALDVALRMRLHLTRHDPLPMVEMTRGGKSAPDRQSVGADLDLRCRLANEAGATCYISVHCNAAEDPRAHGFEVWTSPGWTRADPLATAMWEGMSREFPDRRGRLDMCDGDPDKESRFRVLVGTRMPAVLIELGFLSNPEEERWLGLEGVRERIAMCQARAVLQWLGQDGAPA